MVDPIRAAIVPPPGYSVALTGYGQEQDQRRSEEAGFAFHLVKPVDVERLTHLVDGLPTGAG